MTVNADGTIAGAQGLNLTDGRGRMIPVNLSVSIPMPTLGQINEDNSSQVVPSDHIYTTDDGASINVLSDTSDRLSPVSPCKYQTDVFTHFFILCCSLCFHSFINCFF